MEIIKMFGEMKILQFFIDNRFIINAFIFVFEGLSFLFIKFKQGNVINLNSILKVLRNIALVVILGVFVYELEFKINITLEFYVNLLFISLVTLMLYCIYGYFVYYKSLSRFYSQILTRIKQLSLLTLLVISSNGNLFFEEFLILLIILYLVEIIDLDIVFIRGKNKNNNISIELKSDLPVEMESNLFKPRRNQLKIIRGYLSDKGQTFQSIAINGGWGQGKTSFVNALMKEMGEIKIVYIDPNIDTDLDSMLKQLVYQIEKHLKDEEIYTGRGSALDNYIKFITSIISEGRGEWINDLKLLFSVDQKTGAHELRSNLESDFLALNETNSLKLVIIVDDLDRCSKGTILEVIKFLNTVFSLRGCTLLFLIDVNQIEEIGIDRLFLEKYIIERFDLTDTSNEIISDFFIDKGVFLSESFYESFEEDLKNQLREFVLSNKYYGNFFIEKIKKGIQENSDKQSDIRAKKEDKEFHAERVECLTEELYNIQKKINNPRCVKRYFRELERGIVTIDEQWFKDDLRKQSGYNKIDWIEVASSISFIKSFMEKEYDHILQYSSIEDYVRKSDNPVIHEYVLGISKYLIGGTDKRLVINKLLFDIYLPSVGNDLKENQIIENQIKKGCIEQQYIVRVFENIVWQKEFRDERLKVLIESLKRIDKEKEKKEVIIELFEKLTRMTGSTRELCLDFFETLCSVVLLYSSLYELKDVNQLLRMINLISEHFIFGSSVYIQILFEIHSPKEQVHDVKENLMNVRTFKELNDYVETIFKISGKEKGKVEEICIDNINEIIKKLKYEHPKIIELIEHTSNILIKNLSIAKYLVEFAEQLSGIELKNEEIDFDISFTKDDNELLVHQLKTFRGKISKLENIKYNSEVVRNFTDLCRKLDEMDMKIDGTNLNLLLEVYEDIDNRIVKEDSEILWWDYTRLRLYKMENEVIPSIKPNLSVSE